MRQTVQHTTQKLIDLLPENEQYYRLDELRSWGFPAFIVQRIKVELERNMAESMILPQTDWANISSDAVQHAWKQFVQAIRAEARLPASYARAVIETAVVDVLDMLTEPRKNIPDVIFGGDEELDFEELTDRIEAVVVYPHFAALVPRYMQKKELDSLSKKRCIQLIKKADEKLTDNYSPLNWAQTLDSLFQLLDGKIDPSLLRLYFEDKNKEQIAEVFDRRDETLSRAEFIEILSSPDLLDTTAHYSEAEMDIESEDEEPELTGEQEEKQIDISEKNRDDTLEEPGREQNQPELFDNKKDDTSKEKLSNQQNSDEETGDAEEEIDEESASMNSSFTEEETSSDADAEADETDSLNAVFEEQKEDAELASAVEKENNSEEEEEAEQELSQAISDPEEEEVDPMWMHFMSDEDKAAMEAEEDAEEITTLNFEEDSTDESVDEGGFIDEPIIDLTEEETSEQEIEKLKDQLSGQEDYFVKEIFGGSEQAYREAVEGVASFDDWQNASKYIQNEIFKRNLVDMYSEPAVDFTDRLQNYFLEKEKTDN